MSLDRFGTAVEHHHDLADLLATPGVEEHCVLRSAFGFMAYHGGALEEMTDVVATRAAAASGASYYGIVQPPGMRAHIPSTLIDPRHSVALAEFLGHVDVVITVHGYGRRGHFRSILVGGGHRALAGTTAACLRRHLPAYEIVDDLDAIPADLRGLHRHNPVNRTREGGVQIELPPRVRGSSPLWWDWDPLEHRAHGPTAGAGPSTVDDADLVPHTRALIAALAEAARQWSD